MEVAINQAWNDIWPQEATTTASQVPFQIILTDFKICCVFCKNEIGLAPSKLKFVDLQSVYWLYILNLIEVQVMLYKLRFKKSSTVNVFRVSNLLSEFFPWLQNH